MPCRLLDVRRLVALASVGNGRKVGRVGFDQHVVERDLRRRVANLLRLGKADIPGKGNHEAHVQRAFRVWPGAGETVQDSAETGWVPVLLDERETVVPCVLAVLAGTTMDDDRQFRRTRKLHLADEYVLLHVARRVVVIVVEADLSPSDDLRPARELLEFCEIGVFSQLGLVRMNADARINEVVLLSNPDRAIECPGPVAGSDAENVGDTSFLRPSDDLLAIRIEARAVEVAVGIDVHEMLVCGAGTLARNPFIRSLRRPRG